MAKVLALVLVLRHSFENRSREYRLQVCVEFLQNLMSGFNVLLLQSVDKEAKKEPIASRTRAYKKKKVSPIHIVNVKSSNRLRHP